MGILGRHIVMGFGDVGVSARVKGKVFDPSAKIDFYQLKSPHYDPSTENADTSVVPITLIADLRGLEMLHNLTYQLLNEIYDKQLAVMKAEEQRLQTQES